MAGKKGRSGRRGWDKELQSKQLWDLSIPVLKHALKSKDTKQDKKIDIGLFLVGKMLPQTQKLEHTGDLLLEIISYAKSKQ